jgi:hemerythrin superfamily protein
MEESSILNLMVNHHVLLAALFTLFRDEARDKSPRTGSSLSELTWELKKHFFTEESAIFNLPQVKEMKIYETIQHLEGEHVEMLNSLKKFAEEMPNVNEEEIQKFYEMLEDHRETEEKELYPKLNAELQEEQKKIVISRIIEIPISQR